MQMASFVEALQSDLEQIAAVGDDAVSSAAQRLAGALKASAGLRLLDVLTEAALDTSKATRVVGTLTESLAFRQRGRRVGSSGWHRASARLGGGLGRATFQARHFYRGPSEGPRAPHARSGSAKPTLARASLSNGAPRTLA